MNYDIGFVPTVEITLEEYERLKHIEREFNEYKLSPDDDYVIVENYNGWTFSNRRILSKDAVLKRAITEKEVYQKKLEELRQKHVPMFNKPGKRVKDLLETKSDSDYAPTKP